MQKISIATNKNRGGEVDTSDYSFAATENIRRLHKSLKVYNVTPLVELKNFAREKNVAAVYVKDESSRFGLKAFKGLGSIWAIYTVISSELGLNNPSLEEIFQRRDEISEMTFITTTDGNHGKGVSWAAGLFGCKSYVYMPKGTVEVRAQAVRDAWYLGNAQINDSARCAQTSNKSDATSRCRDARHVGNSLYANAACCVQTSNKSDATSRCDAVSATVEITNMNYDDCVKFTAQLAAKNHWHLIQDTSWDGYEEIPAQIMLGYSTLAYEALEQMNHEPPTHIFLQAGVGSMAGAIAAVFAENFSDNPPRITIVEPTEVACFYESFKIGDGKIHTATGNGQTMMAGLNCATPCELAWKFLRRYAADAATISDDVAAAAMRQLAHPFGDDKKIISGESGCAGFALLNAAVDSPELRRALELDEHSKIFVINTEGDTDPVNYARQLGMSNYFRQHS